MYTPYDFATLYTLTPPIRLRRRRKPRRRRGPVTSTLNTFDCYTAGGDVRWDVGARAHLASVDCSAGTPPPFTTQYTYALAREQLSMTDPGGTPTSSTYDLDGNVGTHTDENGDVTTYGHSPRDELVKEIRPFDTTVTPARMLTTVYQYDPVGNVKREISPRAYSRRPTRSRSPTTSRRTSTTSPTGWCARICRRAGRTPLRKTSTGKPHEEQHDALHRPATSPDRAVWRRTRR